MPDYFVPLDTTAYTDYYRQLISTGLFNRFMLQFVDEHRKQLLGNYTDFNDFNRKYNPSDPTLKELVSFAAEEGLEFSEADWGKSESRISLLFKSYMARDLYGMEYFYQVSNTSDEVFLKAVEILDNPSMLDQKLAKVD